jgi:hypothetical protein
MIVDELRLIEHTNTQVRLLSIVSQILKTIGSLSYSLSVLEEVMIKWSVEQEFSSLFYKNHNGKLTNEGKPTTAFIYYIELMINLGLVTRISNVIRCSKYGNLFLTLMKYNNSSAEFSGLEKLFFIFFILYKDADNILLIFQMIKNNGGVADSTSLRNHYEGYLKERLKIKAMKANAISQIAIIDKLRKIENVWKNARGYSKHIIPPRLEWLLDIGFLYLIESKKVNNFVLTEIGTNFYNSLEVIDNSDIPDIDDVWLIDTFIYKLNNLYLGNELAKDFKSLNSKEINSILGELLPTAYRELDIDGLKRISALPFYIFTMSVGLIKHNVAISFSSLKELLGQSFSIKEYTFAFRDAKRINESYITISIH